MNAVGFGVAGPQDLAVLQSRQGAPTPQSLATLAAHPRLRGSSDPLVVSLDDLDRFLTTKDTLTSAMLDTLFARSGPAVVMATLRPEARVRLRTRTGV